MTKLAVDIVLLPEEAMRDYAIAANTEIVAKFGSEIILNKKDCLPHISLAMGCVERKYITDVGKALQPLVAITPRRLKLVGIQKSTNLSGEIVSVLKVERSDLLQTLHEKICDAVKPWFTCGAAAEMIAGGQVSPSTLRWIKEYPVKSSHCNFSPHITVGYGDLTDRTLPADFAVRHLAMCHLGNHCTCKKILWSAEI
jgi:2'-5' RNA ligase